jgi:hypothetical protein
MKPSLIALISAIIFLGSCSNSQQEAEDNSTDTVVTVDAIKQVDTVKSDTVAVKKSNSISDEERDQKIMDDILKNKKTVK